jgi:hypothetical protein
MTRHRWLAVACLTLVTACAGSRGPAAPTAPGHHPIHDATAPDVAALVRRADEAFVAFQAPDYQRPFTPGPDVPAQISSLYLEACLAGNHRSCWLSDAFSPSRRAKMMVRRNCLAGDLKSCRAISEEWRSEPDKRLPGWAGRTLACDTPQCRHARRQECAGGFPTSCEESEFPIPYYQMPYHRRLIERALEGCLEGILAECRWLMSTSSDGEAAIVGARQLCMMTMTECSQARTNDPVNDRDLLEHACQYGHGDEQATACRYAEAGYYVPELNYPEPYPGHARKLAEWNCTRKNNPAMCLPDLDQRTPVQPAP